MRQGFTVTEVLVVTGIVAVVAAIALPVFLRARAAADRTACLSNARQVGLAMTLYLGDSDERTPATRPTFARWTFAAGIGWAGRIAPYAKGTGAFRCPSDRRELPRPGLTLPGSQTVSYGLNGNLTELDGVSSAVSSARTILLFEVSGGRARLDFPDEGATIAPGTYRLVSAEGTGTYGSILHAPIPWPAMGPAQFTLYATGVMDNAQGAFDGSNDFDDPRHGAGANFLALDGHAVWSEPLRVSAGYSAREPGNAQSERGCRDENIGGRPEYQCAEGTARGDHRLTFSAR